MTTVRTLFLLQKFREEVGKVTSVATAGFMCKRLQQRAKEARKGGSY